MKKLDENAKWWVSSEKEWSYQDKSGDWWLIRGGKVEQEKMTSCVNPLANLDSKKMRLLSTLFSWTGVLGVVCVFALGASLTLNIYLYMLIKSLGE